MQTNVRSGAMTTAMRAVQREKRRALRIGSLDAGRVTSERVIVDAKDLGSPKVFEREGDRWTLRLPPDATARLAVRGVTGDLDALRAAGLATWDARGWTIALDDDARGKIMLAEGAFLFQLVEPPLAQAKAQLPISVRGGMALDWRFTVLASLSFLAHFAFAGAVNGEAFDPQVDDTADAAQFIAEAKARADVPMEQPAQTKAIDKTASDGPKVATAVDAPKSNAGAKGATGSTSGHAPSTSAGFANNATAMSDALDQMNMGVLGSYKGPGPSTSIVLGKGPTPADQALDEIAKKKLGITTDDNHLKMPGESEPGYQPPGKTSCIACTVPGPGKTPVAKPTTPIDEPAPKIPPTLPPIIEPPATDPGVGGVIMQNKWRFTACFTKALNKNEMDGGTIRVTFSIGQGGDVTASSGTSSDASSMLTQCVASAFFAMHFSEPLDGFATYTIPVVLRRK